MSEVNTLSWTAGNLMSRDLETVHVETPLRDVARQLIRRGVHGAPVVDDGGRCVGVLSVTDIVRWISRQDNPQAQLPRTCAFQETAREPGGREIVQCLMAEGVCPFQRVQTMADGTECVVCREPHCVPTDWQMVEVESLPGDRVRDYMTTIVVSADPETPLPALARLMLDHGVHRLLVLDPSRHPVGVVSANDLLRAVAQLDSLPAGARP